MLPQIDHDFIELNDIDTDALVVVRVSKLRTLERVSNNEGIEATKIDFCSGPPAPLFVKETIAEIFDIIHGNTIAIHGTDAGLQLKAIGD